MKKQPRWLPPATAGRIYFWNMAGSVCNAANTVFMTLIVTRVCGAGAAGIYSFALAMTQLVGSVARFEVRNFQVTDAKKEYSFSEYHTARLFSVAVATLFMAIWSLLQGYTGEKLMVIVLCCVFKLLECYEDVYQGLLQLQNRLDLVGQSFALRIVIDTALFTLLLYVTHQLVVSLVVYTLFAAIWILVVTVPIANTFETPKWAFSKRLWTLFLSCLPLFLTNFLMSYIISAPKYAIDIYLSSEMQTYFSTLFMPASVVNLFTIILYQLYLTRMAKDWTDRRWGAFTKRTVFLLGWIGLLGVVALGGAWLLGIPVLSWIYKLPQLDPFRLELMIVILGGIFSAAASWMNLVLTIMRRQILLLFGNTLAAGLMVLLISPLVRQLGLRGAALGYLVVMLLLMLFQFTAVGLVLKKSRRECQAKRDKT